MSEHHHSNHPVHEGVHLHNDHVVHHRYHSIASKEESDDITDAPRPRRRSSISMQNTTRWHEMEQLWPAPKQVRMGNANDMEYTHEKDMSWSELFFDLIFVVTIARLGEHAREPTTSGISFDDGTYVEYFALFFLFWLQANVYGTRFAHNDAPNMVYFGMMMLGTIGMTMHISGGFDGEAFPKFALSAALTCAVDIWVYSRIWLTPDPDPPEEKRVTTSGRNFGKVNVFFNSLRLLPFLALGCDLIEYRRGVFEWCICTFFMPFVVVVFMPCCRSIPKPARESAAPQKVDLLPMPIDELKLKIDNLRKAASQVEHLLIVRCENPSLFHNALGRAEGSNTPESKNDDEVYVLLLFGLSDASCLPVWHGSGSCSHHLYTCS